MCCNRVNDVYVSATLPRSITFLHCVTSTSGSDHSVTHKFTSTYILSDELSQNWDLCLRRYCTVQGAPVANSSFLGAIKTKIIKKKKKRQISLKCLTPLIFLNKFDFLLHLLVSFSLCPLLSFCLTQHNQQQHSHEVLYFTISLLALNSSRTVLPSHAVKICVTIAVQKHQFLSQAAILM